MAPWPSMTNPLEHGIIVIVDAVRGPDSVHCGPRDSDGILVASTVEWTNPENRAPMSSRKLKLLAEVASFRHPWPCLIRKRIGAMIGTTEGLTDIEL